MLQTRCAGAGWGKSEALRPESKEKGSWWLLSAGAGQAGCVGGRDEDLDLDDAAL